MRGVTPYLQVADTGEAIDWYQRVFDAQENRARLIAPDGTCMNAEIEIEGSLVMLADATPSVGSKTPGSVDGTTVVMNLHLADVDAVFQRAVDAGAEVIFPLADQFYGDRAGRVRDPFGHHWILATRIRDVPEAEMVAAFEAMFQGS